MSINYDHESLTTMKLYKTTAIYNGIATSSTPDRISFQGSQTEASKARSGAKADGYKAITQDIDVPTGKDGLLAWLNANMTA